MRSEKGIVNHILAFTGTLDELTVIRAWGSLELVWAMSCGIARPMRLKATLRDGLQRSIEGFGSAHRNQDIEWGLGRNKLQDFLREMLVIGDDKGF